jgi:hypothetical protein
MDNKQNKQRSHFILSNTARSERYQPIKKKITSIKPPEQDRVSHGQSLLNQLNEIKSVAEQVNLQQDQNKLSYGLGLQIAFTSLPDVELAIKSLSDATQGIELMNVRHDEHHSYATVFVPNGKLIVFEQKITDYLNERKNKSGKALDHKALINTIKEIRTAAFNELWTDSNDALPKTEQEIIWWEIWLPLLNNRAETTYHFRNIAKQIGFELSNDEIKFPERTVLLLRGSKQQIQQSIRLLNYIAEIKRAKETAGFFESLKLSEQREWLDDLLYRTHWPNDQVPYICILDTGINYGHPLLKPALNETDLHTIEPSWGTADQHGHGTEMAGLALWGDLTEAFETNDQIFVKHRLESVKLLPQSPANEGRHHGNLTIEAISRAEISAPNRLRVFNLSVTAKDNRDRGRPSAWSATLDKLACDIDDENLSPRLIVVSGGNIDDHQAWLYYPASNTSDSIHDPGQAWNILTVGAYTQKTELTNTSEIYQPLAAAGGLSPFSTTSSVWQKQWPLKPDVVFEGGNLAKTDQYTTPYIESTPSLSLLTTDYRIADNLLTISNRTSAATALCSRMAAQLIAQYPKLWPETIRALIVHSAEWTQQMKNDFLDPKQRKQDYECLIRHCGFGVPNLHRALWSAANSLTLIVQNQLQPFILESGKEPHYHDMHLHHLPWPTEDLQKLGATPVEMRVTLSYFIEPNPGIIEKGNAGRYLYESHSLRFEVKRPTEIDEEFRRRINQRAKDEEEGSNSGGGTDPDWLLGANLRHLGSLHSDIWTGTAAELAKRGLLAVYPVTGWWKSRKKLNGFNKKARYALIVSIKTPETDIDLYTAIENILTVSVNY